MLKFNPILSQSVGVLYWLINQSDSYLELFPFISPDLFPVHFSKSELSMQLYIIAMFFVCASAVRQHLSGAAMTRALSFQCESHIRFHFLVFCL